MYEGSDRSRQMNAIEEASENILRYDLAGTGKAEDAEGYVEYWMENTVLPNWWTEFDTGILLNKVAEKLA